MPHSKKIKAAVVSPCRDITVTAVKSLPELKAKVYVSAPAFISAAISNQLDLAVVDMNLPDINGRDLLMVLRQNLKTHNMLLVAVSNLPKSTSEITAGLETGADEYFILPRDASLMRPRLANLLSTRAVRKATAVGLIQEEAPIKIGLLEINRISRVVSLKGREIPLTALEFDILMYFHANTERIVSRGTLVQQVWKTDLGVNLRSVDTRIEFLRKKLKGAQVNIATVFGMGYILKM